MATHVLIIEVPDDIGIPLEKFLEEAVHDGNYIDLEEDVKQKGDTSEIDATIDFCNELLGKYSYKGD
jgi:hypothetical protein